jgi:anaerobic selenocysteine-containing dehydrogenase
MTEYRKTACTLHCPNGCALLAEMGPNPLTGEVEPVRLKGNPDHPFTRGLMCAKTGRFLDRLRSPDRVVRPLLRRGGGFVEVSWDRALGLAAERLQALRGTPERILHVWYWHSFGVLAQASKLLFNTLGASTFKGDPCNAAGMAAVRQDFGGAAAPAWTDLLASDRIVNWGWNLSAQGPHQGRIVREARGRGARVLSITPGDGDLLPFSDVHIRIRPGTDRFLAAAVARLLMDSGRVPKGAMDRAANRDAFGTLLAAHSVADCLAACDASRAEAATLADWYAAAGATATLIGRGMQRYRSGGENVRWIDALVLASGQIGRPGGGVYYRQGSPAHLDVSWVQAAPGMSKRLSFARLGREIEAADPPVEFVWIEGMNPVAMGPESLELQRALGARFTVAVEPFMTDTALCADLILPPAMMLETEDVCVSNAHEYIHHAAQVARPRGEARSNFAIAAGLAARLDPPVPYPDPQEVLKRALDTPVLKTDLGELRARGFVRGVPPATPWADGVFGHKDGRYRLPKSLTPEPLRDEEFPLRLLSFIRKNSLLSQLPEAAQAGPATVFVAPDCPALAGLDRGAPVWLETPLGRLPVLVEIREGFHPEGVLYPRGDWLKCGRGVNRLVQGVEADLGGQVAYYAQGARLVNAG